MALDTAGKRNSALLDPGNMPWPPDGAISVDDRLTMLEFYSGIPFVGPVITEPTVESDIILGPRQVTISMKLRATSGQYS